MLHKHRRYTVAVVATVDELAEKLVNHTWCGCNGWQVQGTPYLFLNDSFDGGTQEYAVVRCNDDGTMFQLESITFGWIDDVEKAKKYIENCLSGAADDVMGRMPVTVVIEDPKQHGRCHCCM